MMKKNRWNMIKYKMMNYLIRYIKKIFILKKYKKIMIQINK